MANRKKLFDPKLQLWWPILYVFLLVVIFGWAALRRFSLPQFPWGNKDTWGYLHPALSELTGGEFKHTNGRSFLYPGFLYLVLRGFGDFRFIGLFQHLLGGAAGGLLLLAWERARSFLPRPLVPLVVYRAMGLGVTAFYLFATTPMLFEQDIRPESICPFFAALNIFFTLEFIRCAYLKPRRSAALCFGILSVFSAYFLQVLKPSFGLTMAFSTLPVWIYCFQKGEVLWRKLVLLGLSALFIYLFLQRPEQQLAQRDLSSRTFVPATLFFIHADIIERQMAVDLTHLKDIPYAPDLLAKAHAALVRELNLSKGTGKYKSLGFDPDYLMYEDSLDVSLLLLFDHDAQRQADFYLYYYQRALMHQPVKVLRKVAGQMALFYGLKCPAYHLPAESPFGWRYEKTLRDMSVNTDQLSFVNYQPAQRWTTAVKALETINVSLNPSYVVWISANLLAVLYLPVLLLTLGAGLFLACRPNLKDRPLLFMSVLFLLYGYNLGNCLGISIVHSLEIVRYRTVQLIFTVLPHALALVFLAEIFLSIRQQRLRRVRSD